MQNLGSRIKKLSLIETNCHPRAGGDPVKKELMAKPKEKTYLEGGRDFPPYAIP